MSDDLPLFQTPPETAASLLNKVAAGGLNAVAEAVLLARVAREFRYRQEQIAQVLGRSRAAIANSIRLLDLPTTVREALAEGKLTVGHAKVILGASTAEARCALAQAVIEQGLTVREAQKRLDLARNPASHPGPEEQLRRFQERLATYLGAEVTFSGDEESGEITIEHQGIDDLQRLANLMGLP